jgi:hypothetical protein
VVGCALLVAGFLLRVWATFHFYKNGMRVISLSPQRTLITSGPYRLSRNPLYLGGKCVPFSRSVIAVRIAGGGCDNLCSSSSRGPLHPAGGKASRERFRRGVAAVSQERAAVAVILNAVILNKDLISAFSRRALKSALWKDRADARHDRWC